MAWSRVFTNLQDLNISHPGKPHRNLSKIKRCKRYPKPWCFNFFILCFMWSAGFLLWLLSTLLPYETCFCSEFRLSPTTECYTSWGEIFTFSFFFLTLLIQPGLYRKNWIVYLHQLFQILQILGNILEGAIFSCCGTELQSFTALCTFVTISTDDLFRRWVSITQVLLVKACLNSRYRVVMCAVSAVK